jgi:hypothetical protein
MNKILLIIIIILFNILFLAFFSYYGAPPIFMILFTIIVDSFLYKIYKHNNKPQKEEYVIY